MNVSKLVLGLSNGDLDTKDVISNKNLIFVDVLVRLNVNYKLVTVTKRRKRVGKQQK